MKVNSMRVVLGMVCLVAGTMNVLKSHRSLHVISTSKTRSSRNDNDPSALERKARQILGWPAVFSHHNTWYNLSQWNHYIQENKQELCRNLQVFANSRRQPRKDNNDDPIVMTLIAGRNEGSTEDPLNEWFTLLKSIILMSSQDVLMYIATDAGSVSTLQDHCHQAQFVMEQQQTGITIQCFVFAINKKSQVQAWRKEANLDYFDRLIDHHSGEFGAAKMFFPRVFQFPNTTTTSSSSDKDNKYNHPPMIQADAMFMDTDMVFADDPANLWKLRRTDTTSDKELWKMRIRPFPCSCIMIIHYDRLRQLDVHPEEGGMSSPYFSGTKTYMELLDWAVHKAHATHRKERHPKLVGQSPYYPYHPADKVQSFGDQRILLSFQLIHKDVVGEIPSYWNREGARNFNYGKGYYYQLDKSGAFHENCGKRHWFVSLYEEMDLECVAGGRTK